MNHELNVLFLSFRYAHNHTFHLQTYSAVNFANIGEHKGIFLTVHYVVILETCEYSFELFFSSCNGMKFNLATVILSHN